MTSSVAGHDCVGGWWLFCEDRNTHCHHGDRPLGGGGGVMLVVLGG